MTRIGPLTLRATATWRYALVGGVASIPFTIALYWASGAGSDFSLNMVFFGGLFAGYLARAASNDADSSSAGVRAGVVGSLPGLWILSHLLDAAAALAGPLWFQVAAVSIMALAVVAFLLGFGGVVGWLGARVGAWLAVRTGGQRLPLGG